MEKYLASGLGVRTALLRGSFNVVLQEKHACVGWLDLSQVDLCFSSRVYNIGRDYLDHIVIIM